MIGFLRGFTTFSSFSLQTMHPLLDDRVGAGFGYAGLSVFSCVIGAFIGFGGMKWLHATSS